MPSRQKETKKAAEKKAAPPKGKATSKPAAKTKAAKPESKPKAKKGKFSGPISYEGYCVKCQEKRDIKGEKTTMKNGRPLAKGPCPKCGTTVVRILSTAEAE